MMQNELVSRIMFEYETYTEQEIVTISENLSPKILRWLGTNHPDNKTRKIFLTMTGVTIGIDTVINPYCVFSDGYKKLIQIGKRCAISPHVSFIAQSAPNNSNLVQNEYVQKNLIQEAPIVIGDDVWIGTNATILYGVSIGNSSVIGAGSVVVKNVPNNVIFAGNPAKMIKEL